MLILGLHASVQWCTWVCLCTTSVSAPWTFFVTMAIDKSFPRVGRFIGEKITAILKILCRVVPSTSCQLPVYSFLPCQGGGRNAPIGWNWTTAVVPTNFAQQWNQFSGSSSAACSTLLSYSSHTFVLGHGSLFSFPEGLFAYLHCTFDGYLIVYRLCAFYNIL